MNKTIIIVTGGTGGHIFPAQAVVTGLNKGGFRVIVFGDKNYSKYHQSIISNKFHIIYSSQIKKSLFSFIGAVIKISFGVCQSLWWILKYRPQAIVAFGGYATFPSLVAGVVLRKKIVLHEQNSHLGKVNRIFAKYAHKIALSYKKTDGVDNNFSKIISITGNPVREKIIALSQYEYKLPNLDQPFLQSNNLGYDVLLHSDFRNQKELVNRKKFNILILGGSGGAEIFSKILPKAFFNLRDKIKNNLQIIQQCRHDLLNDTFNQYKPLNINIVINSFFSDIDEKIKNAHLIIARAGSSSLAEFTCAKKPMILVPFALATDNHQEKNAKYIEKMGGAVIIKEQDFTINNITKTLEKLIDNPAILKKMSNSSLNAANLNATNNMVRLVANTKSYL